MGERGTKLFLSYPKAELEAARELARKLRAAGLEVWMDVDELRPGDAWMPRLEEAIQEVDAFAVYVGRGGVRRFVDLEVRSAIVRSVEDPGFRLIPVLGPGADPGELPFFLAQNQWLDLRDEVDGVEGLKRLVAALLDREPDQVPLLPPGTEPFRGLRAFEAEQAELFFGREQEIEELLGRMQRDPFLTVVGDSGSGKSSLVRAGLIPALHRGRYREPTGRVDRWRVAVLRPGADPFASFVYDAVPQLRPELDYAELSSAQLAWRDRSRAGTEGITDCVVGALETGERALVVVDQFEELFTSTASAETRRRWLDSLLAAAGAHGERVVHVVAVIRSDFYSRCWEHPDLPERVARNLYPVQRMPAERLSEVIRNPLRLAGGRMADGLEEVLLGEVGDEPGNLPLLEHALDQLWSRHRGAEITHQDYEEIGRLKGALAHHADDAFEALTEDQQEIARRVFLSLTQVGEGAEDTRRRVRKSKILSLRSDRAGVGAVLDRLTGARLLTATRVAPGADDEGGEPVEMLEVAHETLIRNWPRLREWIEESRDDLRIRRRLEAMEREWREHGRSADYLVSAGRLPEAEAWARESADRPNPEVREYLAKSKDVRDRAAREEEARRLRELRLARRFSRSLAVALVLAVGLGVGAWLQWRASLDRERIRQRNIDAQTLVLLTEAAGELWPVHPAREDDLEGWLAKAEQLRLQLPVHRTDLKALEDSSDERDPIEPDAPLEAGAGGFRLPDPEDAGSARSLRQLIRGLEAFFDPETGLVDGSSPGHGLGVRRRLLEIERLRGRTLEGDLARQRWSEARESIASSEECPLYRGLELEPQFGLLPIGRDPTSGLWEFAHLATGLAPARDPDGDAIKRTEEMAIVFVLVPGGSFLMGAEPAPGSPNYDLRAAQDEGPPHAVRVSAFFASKFEMTQGQWQRAFGGNPSWYFAGGEAVGTRFNFLHPVENVRWDECTAAMWKLGLALPTEAQWEYAARGGRKEYRPWAAGAAAVDLCGAANLGGPESARQKMLSDENAVFECPDGYEDGFVVTAPVGSYRPNDFGLHDVHGNVWEWCADGLSYYWELAEPSGERSGDVPAPCTDPLRADERPFRGAGFSNDAEHARLARRSFQHGKYYLNDSVGLRPVRRIE